MSLSQKILLALLFMSLQIDTKDILFICGGAFIDLEKTISERSYYLPIVVLIFFPFSLTSTLFLQDILVDVFRRQDSSIGFGAPVRANMRTGGVTSAAVTSSLLEIVSSSILQLGRPTRAYILKSTFSLIVVVFCMIIDVAPYYLK